MFHDSNLYKSLRSDPLRKKLDLDPNTFVINVQKGLAVSENVLFSIFE